MQDELQSIMPSSKLNPNMMSDLKSDHNKGSSSNEARNKEYGLLSAFNSANKQNPARQTDAYKQPFMNKFSQSLVKDMSFGGP